MFSCDGFVHIKRVEKRNGSNQDEAEALRNTLRGPALEDCAFSGNQKRQHNDASPLENLKKNFPSLRIRPGEITPPYILLNTILDNVVCPSPQACT